MPIRLSPNVENAPPETEKAPPDEQPDSVAERIGRLIGERYGGSQRKFAVACGVDAKRVTSWLHDNEPSADNLRKIAMATGVSLDWLLLGKGKPRYRSQARAMATLEADLAAAVQRVIETEELPHGKNWKVNGRALLAEVTRLGVTEAKAWEESARLGDGPRSAALTLASALERALESKQLRAGRAQQQLETASSDVFRVIEYYREQHDRMLQGTRFVKPLRVNERFDALQRPVTPARRKRKQ